MNVLRTAAAGATVLALAFGAAGPVYAAAPTSASHVTLAPADGPTGGDNGGWWAPRVHRHHHHFRGHRFDRDDRGMRRHHRRHGFGRPWGPVRAGGGAMAASVAELTSHIGG